MRRPAVFFDRDNTLIVGNDYLGDPAGVVLVAGAPAAVATCRNLGFAVVVVSNQSGVARGKFTEAAVAAVNREMDKQLKAVNGAAVVDRHEYCPHHPDGSVDQYRQDCDCRKPKPGMIFAAADAMALDLPASWMVGDAPRDVAAGHAAGCRTILIVDSTLSPSPAALDKPAVPAEFTVGSLVEAVDVIVQQAARPMLPKAYVPAPVAPPPEPPRTVAAAPGTPAPTDAPPAPRPSAAAPATSAERDRPATASAQPAAAPRMDLSRLETASQQILMELKKLNDTRQDDFSISKLIAGIVQTLALGALPVAYVLYRNDPAVFQAWLLTAIFLQTFTIAMLVMGRQR